MQFYHLAFVRGGALEREHTHKHKSLYIPYLDNIETTSIKIFVKTTEISGKSDIFLVNRLLSVIDSTLAYVRILNVSKIQERLGVSLGKVTIGRCNLIDTTHKEVYLG